MSSAKSKVLTEVEKDGSFLKNASEALRNDKDVVFKAVKQNGISLQYAGKELRDDEEVVFEAVKRFGSSLEFASERLKNDNKLVLEAVAQDGNFLNFAGEEIKKNRRVVVYAVKQLGSLRFATEELFLNDRFIVLEAVKQNGLSLKYVSDELKKDRGIVIEALRQNFYAFEYASEELRNDRSIALEAVRRHYITFLFVGQQLKNDRELAIEALKKDKGALSCFSEELMNDKEFILNAVKHQSISLLFAGEELKKDKEAVLEAVRNDGLFLEHVCDKLKKDREIVLEAVKVDRKAIQYVGEELRKDKEICLSLFESVKRDVLSIEQSGDYEGFKIDRELEIEIVLKALKENVEVLRYVSEDLRNNREFFLEAVKEDRRALKYANEELKHDSEIIEVARGSKTDREILKAVLGKTRSKGDLQALLYVRDKEIVLEVVKDDGLLLQYLNEEFKNDKEIVREALEEDDDALHYVGEKLKNDKEFFVEVVKKDGLLLRYASEVLKKDLEVVFEALKEDDDALKYVSEDLANRMDESGMEPIEWALKEIIERKVVVEEEKRRLIEKRLKEKESQWEEERKAMTDENQQMLDRVLDSVGRGFRIHHNKLEIDREGKLGKGGFGSVFRASFSNEHGEIREVAAKVIGYGFQTDGVEVFKEFSRSLQFRHENVIKTIGFDDSRKNEIAIVMEKLDGNLHDYVRENVLKLEKKFEIMKMMMKGIHYLHSMKPKPFLHRDIKGENFLYQVDEAGELCHLKVCDFGLAKAVVDETQQTQVSAAGQGTKLWMAPESGRGKYSVKSDVYSLGIAFWEILFEEYPYGGFDPNHVFYKVEMKGLRPDLNLYVQEEEEEQDQEENEGEDDGEEGHLPKFVIKLLERCWDGDRKKRPSTQDLKLWFDDHDLEIAERGDVYFPPLEIQKKTRFTCTTTVGLNVRHNRNMREGEEDEGEEPEEVVVELKEKIQVLPQRENGTVSIEFHKIQEENKRLELENKRLKERSKMEIKKLKESSRMKIKWLRMENERLRKFMAKSNMLKEYLKQKDKEVNGGDDDE